MKPLSDRALMKRLKNAYVCCKDCGTKYGVYSVGCSSSYDGICDVCGEEKSITETRDYAFLITGIRQLRQSIEDKRDAKKEAKKNAQQ
jgi:hypothetical protein